jgi:hypothetical protein
MGRDRSREYPSTLCILLAECVQKSAVVEVATQKVRAPVSTTEATTTLCMNFWRRHLPQRPLDVGEPHSLGARGADEVKDS